MIETIYGTKEIKMINHEVLRNHLYVRIVHACVNWHRRRKQNEYINTGERRYQTR